MKTITIATRESQLAMWQATHIQTQLQSLHPELTIHILGMTTKGDQILNKALSKIGGKGLFVKELETALLEGRADIAVHSMKDVPMLLPEGLQLAAICRREEPYDAFVSNQYNRLTDLPAGAIVGTSSLRREAQLRARLPHLTVTPLRGNVQTRLKRLDQEEYNAIILAAAGLVRLGLHERIRERISVENSLPAPGQGALGIEIFTHREDLHTLLAPLNHEQTTACVTAERSLAREMGGSCQIPLGAYAQQTGQTLHLRAMLALPDGSTLLTAEQTAPANEAESLGKQVAHQLNQHGAQALLQQISAS